jgi:SnoaL-like domain
LAINGVQRWRDYVISRDPAMLWEALHPDVVFESPVVHTPQRGREITFKYLTSVVKVLGSPRFSFVGEWTGETGAVLEFTDEIEGITINGVDIISCDADGRITHFKVMVRPLKAVNLLHRLMGEQLVVRF